MIPLACDASGFAPDDQELLDRAALLLSADPSVTFAAGEIALATATEYLRVCNVPHNVAFARSVAAAELGKSRPKVKIGLVPGAFYRDHANTGADGAAALGILATLGCQAELIPVHSFGSLSENARIIHDWLLSQNDVSVVLVSLSKGACDVKAALHALPNAAANNFRLAAWISLSGISTGTPLVRWLQVRPWRWCGVWLLLKLRRQRIDVLRELRHGPEAPLSRWPEFPPGMQIVHIHGFPLERHLTHPWAGRAYKRLAPLGPNDGGGVLLADVARWPGIVFPLWGVDHYLQPKDDLAPQLSRVFQAVLERCA